MKRHGWPWAEFFTETAKSYARPPQKMSQAISLALTSVNAEAHPKPAQRLKAFAKGSRIERPIVMTVPQHIRAVVVLGVPRSRKFPRIQAG